ncbi:hypothetical protein HYQ44_020202 [Verticillium longisporum]|nr:hypothetical protein HYQ44_020202 [Verticillium longisporum]
MSTTEASEAIQSFSAFSNGGAVQNSTAVNGFNGTSNGNGHTAPTQASRALKSNLQPTDPSELHDLVCVGFGPASLAVAVAMHDNLAAGNPLVPNATEKPKVLFLEKQPRFAWHAGMLLPGAKMQISFIKDMATLRDPRSHFTFLNYLQHAGRLVEFTNLGTFLPSRVEYEDYLRWCASHFDDVVQYQREVVSVSPNPQPEGAVKTFTVKSRNAKTGQVTTVQARNVLIAAGGRPLIPKSLPAASPKVIHSSQYAHQVPEILKNTQAPYRVAVVGAGQSAAEIFNNVQKLYPNSKTWLVMRSEFLKPSDDSPFIEETDASPIAAVWREIKEETTLTPAHLNLFRQGKPYSFTDEGVGRIWTVHPFAFHLKDGRDESCIQLDWENEGWTWHDPLDVTDDESFGGVPFLAKSLRRVWFEMDLGEERGKILREGLLMLQDDHSSGARQLAGRALGVFQDIVALGHGENIDVWWRNARFAAWHLWKNGRESMSAAILNVLVRALTIVEREVQQFASNVVEATLLDSITQQLDQYSEARAATIGSFANSLQSVLERARPDTKSPVKILTLSSSSTIFESLQMIVQETDIPLDLRVLESRALFEGAQMASRLAACAQDPTKGRRDAVRITVYSDASAAIASQGVDIVLLGADLISREGDVSNKTGSLPAVLSARHVSPGVQVVVISEREKILPFAAPGHAEENDVAELKRAWDQGTDNDVAGEVVIKNVYFEWVSSDLITTYISEDGELTRGMVAEQADLIEQQADRLFAES